MDEQRTLRQRVGWLHSCACHQHARLGSVTMPSARSVSAVAMNSMRLIGGRDELEDRDLRRDHAIYHACEGQGSHGLREDARWARGFHRQAAAAAQGTPAHIRAKRADGRAVTEDCQATNEYA